MYQIVLFIHSWLRWPVFLLVVWILFSSLFFFFRNRPKTHSQKILITIMVACVHLQLLIGFFLYFGLSPIVHSSFEDLRQIMQVSFLRYWTIEHSLGMIFFAAAVQIGSLAYQRAKNAKQSHKRLAIWLCIALIILVIVMPWPFRKDIGRPLFETSFHSIQTIR